ncbi:MAG TPA: 3-dehydroquinate synthase [Symbiobacteriaceae bacterium]|jgi:3-dehydroquinate synthase|nr:3-dehydroquinate synthase [Symbiobacteriaceae bacterium]
MPQVRVNLADRSYDIHVDRGLIGRLGQLVRHALPKAQRALIITDTNVAARFGNLAKNALEQAGVATTKATVPAGENSKSLAQAYNLYTACVNAQLDRNSVIVALGGGVVGDLAGFVAATYLRGIPFVQVPTTLLAQVDSSIGGKTGVDLPQGKNLVGAFHQPSLVVADLDALTSLPQRELAAGLAEVIKHAVIRDAGFLHTLESEVDRILALDPVVMGSVVERNCQIKGEVVAADETEKGLRAILNFGHTVGHAMEIQLGLGNWLHGECVAVGMCVVTNLAAQVGVLKEPDLPVRLERLLARVGLPTRLPPGLTLAALEPAMRRDKKSEGGQIHWVLPVRAGEVIVTPNVSMDAVQRALEALRR